MTARAHRPHIKTVGFEMPTEQHVRLIRQAGAETMESGARVTPSDIIRKALHEYMRTKP